MTIHFYLTVFTTNIRKKELTCTSLVADDLPPYVKETVPSVVINIIIIIIISSSSTRE